MEQISTQIYKQINLSGFGADFRRSAHLDNLNIF